MGAPWVSRRTESITLRGITWMIAPTPAPSCEELDLCVCEVTARERLRNGFAHDGVV